MFVLYIIYYYYILYIILYYIIIIYYILYYTIIIFYLILYSSPLQSHLLSSLPSNHPNPLPSSHLFLLQSSHSFYTCRYLLTVIYIPDSCKNNLTPHVLSDGNVEWCSFISISGSVLMSIWFWLCFELV